MKCLEVVPEAGRYRAVLAEAPDPVPGPDEVLIEVAASGVNRADLSQIAGRYPPPPGEPGILGLEVSGTLVETGERVCALLGGGGHAELVAAPRGQTFPAPKRLDLVAAAGIPEAYLTAFLNLALEGGLARGERVLVHAGASGVGLAAIQTAKLLGASVAATTRTATKLPAIAAAGADLAIDASAGPFPEAIEARFGRDAIHLVLDPIGAESLAGDLRVLATGGRVIFLATMSGAKSSLDLSLLIGKRGRLIGSTLRSRPRPEKAHLVERFRREILPAFDAGALSIPVDSVWKAERAADAFERMRGNRNAGKILIDWRRGG